MMRGFGWLIAAALTVSAVAPAVAAPQWRLERTIALGAPDRWDFVSLSPSGKDVYVAHGDRISVVDLAAGRVAAQLSPIAGAHDAVLVPSVGRIYAGNGRTGKVSIFDAATFKRLGEIAAKPDTDAMAYDRADGLLIVADGDSGFATLIDPVSNMVVATVPIGPGAEGIATDGKGHAFINISDADQLVRLDLRKKTVDRRWALKNCTSPHGLAIDRDTQRLFVSCRNRVMAVLNAANGAVVARLPIGRGSDGAAFDPVRKLAFSSNKDGTISVVAERGADRYRALAPIHTRPGAATMAEDPRSGRIYVATAQVARRLPPHHHGEIPEFRYRPGTLRLLVFAMVQQPGRR